MNFACNIEASSDLVSKWYILQKPNKPSSSYKWMTVHYLNTLTATDQPLCLPFRPFMIVYKGHFYKKITSGDPTFEFTGEFMDTQCVGQSFRLSYSDYCLILYNLRPRDGNPDIALML